jgi:hypothetical protein
MITKQMNRTRFLQIWSGLIGVISIVVALFGFSGALTIGRLDAGVHLITGLLFLAGALFKKGAFVGFINLLLGVFFVIFAVAESNLPHGVVGVLSVLFGVFGMRLKGTKV